MSRGGVVAAGLLVALGAPAFAVPVVDATGDPPSAAPPAVIPASVIDRHYQRGQKHYARGDYATAIAEFQLAYALSSQSGLLFDLAQAHRLDQRGEEALLLYRRFLALAPSTPNRVDVERAIAALEKRLPAPRRVALEPPAPPAAPTPLAIAPAAPPPRRPTPTLLVAGALTLAIGGAALVGALGCAIAQRDAALPRAGRLVDAAAALAVVGAAAAVTGGALLGVALSNRRGDRVALSPLASGALLSAEGRF